VVWPWPSALFLPSSPQMVACSRAPYAANKWPCEWQYHQIKRNLWSSINCGGSVAESYASLLHNYGESPIIINVLKYALSSHIVVLFHRINIFTADLNSILISTHVCLHRYHDNVEVRRWKSFHLNNIPTSSTKIS
jgi:hypothetical protein